MIRVGGKSGGVSRGSALLTDPAVLVFPFVSEWRGRLKCLQTLVTTLETCSPKRFDGVQSFLPAPGKQKSFSLLFLHLAQLETFVELHQLVFP